jgi:hypothetical protein
MCANELPRVGELHAAGEEVWRVTEMQLKADLPLQWRVLVKYETVN